MTDRRTILVVDDDYDLREAVVDALEDHGFRALSAQHGRAALDLLQRSAELPGMILLDVMMPVMNGLAFAAEVKRDPRLCDIPIVIFSAQADHQRAALDIDAVGSLGKPLKLTRLLGVVETVLDGAAHHSFPEIHAAKGDS